MILTNNEYPKTLKWKLQEKLLDITIAHGNRVNVLIAQKTKWFTEKEYELLRKKIEENYLKISDNSGI